MACRYSVDRTVNYFTRDRALSPHEREGRWFGQAAESMGLNAGSKVMPGHFRALLDGFSPDRSIPLLQRRQPHRRAGFDFVVSSDKSLSVAAFCADAEPISSTKSVAPLVIDSFCAAAEALLRLFEAFVLSGDHAGLRSRTGKLAAAVFTHFSSRRLDPHIHSHLVIPNCTQLEDGRWVSLDPASLYRNRSSFDVFFQNELASQLLARGLPASLEKRGALQVATLPIPKKILRRFSTGRVQLERFFDSENASAADHARVNRLNFDKRPQKKKLPRDSFGDLAFRKRSSPDDRRIIGEALNQPLQPPPPAPEPLSLARRVENTLLLSARPFRWKYAADALARLAKRFPALTPASALATFSHIRPEKASLFSSPAPSDRLLSPVASRLVLDRLLHQKGPFNPASPPTPDRVFIPVPASVIPDQPRLSR